MTSLHAEKQFEISSNRLYAQVCPSMGGRLLKLAVVDGPDILVPAEPQSFDTLTWPRGGAYPLVPYHNRIEGGRLVVGAETFDLPPHPAAMPHTLHGPGHTKPWQLVEHTPSRLVMRLSYDRDDHWPWAFEAFQDFELEGNVLTLALTLKNLDDRPMPGGLGWHPYFASPDPVSVDAKYRWPHGDDYLPLGDRVPVTNRQSTKYLPTQYLQDWTEAEIRNVDGFRSRVTATSAFMGLVVHRGDPAHICVEPVSHIANAWNLKDEPEMTGAKIMLPGEVLEGVVRVEVMQAG
ncbi:aldose 1-epimerase [Agrobacterium vitis]|nr:aldose 1-epimerase [Agrobacterium vitis]